MAPGPRVTRRLLNLLALLSLLLCVATLVLWGDSFGSYSSAGWAPSARSGYLLSRRGELYCTTADDPLGQPHPPRWRRIRPEQNDGMYTVDWRVGPRRVLGFALQRQHVGYYRPDPPGTVVWDAVVPYWFLASVTAVLPLALAYTRLRRRRRVAPQCSHCGYDLRATPDRCPECGHVNATAAG